MVKIENKRGTISITSEVFTNVAGDTATRCFGVKGYTDNITVKSIIGRWLEHSRIYRFGDGDDERIFIGSGDLLNRNLERRVEVFTEVTTPETREQVRQVLIAEREDETKGWHMRSDGSFVRTPGEDDTSSQEALYRYFSTRRVQPVSDTPKGTGFLARLFNWGET